jgi:hypothetical protein
MDGRVLEEILTEPVAATAPVAPQLYASAQVNGNGTNGHTHGHTNGAATGSNGYSTDDEETVAERLKALGYVE